MEQVHLRRHTGNRNYKMTATWDSLPFALCIFIGLACGPESSGDPDPEQIIAEFCENLFRCPETEAMLNYDSAQDCEMIHEDDYEIRDPMCRERVLRLEECFSNLTCAEFAELDPDAQGGPCGEERAFLTEKCHPL